MIDDRIPDLGAKATSLLCGTPLAETAKKLADKWRAASGQSKERYRVALHHVVHGGVALPAALELAGLTEDEL